ncbi:hypothetical protein [Thermaerobacillus caldiproteolyticus]|uniref:Uncharacterized protein n=1 Tax=Thermaerobacillus caldiproteolyticus TaxID=247480 RepID=A0A7V9Z7D3_9BACL|nr:hypothetical protein [Anoxybacillus caldiproteolyticus]MBA2875435.1 hypothetical protein [Anoxybacillus caldiproteolyticus]
MYFWNVKALAEELMQKKITPQKKMQYLLAFILVETISVELSYWLGIYSKANIYDVLYSFFSIAINFLGVIFCYKANKRGDNQDFIERFVCIGLPISIRILFLGIVMVGLYIPIGGYFGFYTDSTNIIDFIICILLEVLYYARMRSYILKISTHSI